jgi:O-antigen/teichoic acid export membrane protein
MIRRLAVDGTPFVSVGVAMTLQPVVDAGFLSRLAPVEVVGWYAAARRLFAVLLFPATAINTALYPTLCRLHGRDDEGFRRMSSGGMNTVALLVVPLALGCALYPEIGGTVFGEKSMGAVDLNVRVLGLYLFLLYFSMPLGTCVMATGRQQAWGVVQWLCVVVSFAVDPLVIPWFQRRIGNGGLGLCLAAILSEAMVVGFGIALAPRGIFDARFRRSMGLALVAACAMTLFARVTRFVTPFVAAPVALAVYAGVLWAIGGIDKTMFASLRIVTGPKLRTP